MTLSLLQFFSYRHLSDELKAISQPCCELAWTMASTLPENPETTAGLRKLLEAKDCFVRAKLWTPPEELEAQDANLF